MNPIIRHMRWIMVLSGVLTATMIYAAIAPEAALRSTFGETLEGPLAQVVVRNWGALIALVGAMLIYGAFTPHQRPLILVVAGVSKAVFIGLSLAQGQRYLRQQVVVSIGIDLVMIGLFVWYLVAAARDKQPAAAVMT